MAPNFFCSALRFLSSGVRGESETFSEERALLVVGREGVLGSMFIAVAVFSSALLFSVIVLSSVRLSNPCIGEAW